jgi:hypothetical protein
VLFLISTVFSRGEEEKRGLDLGNYREHEEKKENLVFPN